MLMPVDGTEVQVPPAVKPGPKTGNAFDPFKQMGDTYKKLVTGVITALMVIVAVPVPAARQVAGSAGIVYVTV